MTWYVLREDGTFYATADYKKYTDSKEKTYRIDYTDLPNGNRVSTVFLGLDHAFGEERELGPILFETMVFPANSYTDLHCERYRTLEEAKQGHKRVVEEWANKELE